MDRDVETTPEQTADLVAGELTATGTRVAEDANTVIYPGLPWQPDPAGAKRVIAKSPTMPCTWVIDFEDGVTLWRAFPAADFFTLDGVPAEPFGRFADHRDAAQRAEAADFQIFRRLARNQGKFAELSAPNAYEEAAFGGDSRPFTLAASFFQGTTKALKKNQNGSWDISFNITGDVPRWLLDAPLGELTQVGCLGMGHADDPKGAEMRKRIEDAQKRATLRPSEPEFQEWLMSRYDRWGLMKAAAVKDSVALEEATAETVKRLVGIPSRTDFKTNLDAVKAFEALDREFYFDMAAAKGIYVARR